MTKQTDDQGAAYVPSPRQIRLAAEFVRASWDPLTRLRRRYGRRPEPWTVPEVAETNTAQHGVTRKQNANVDSNKS